MINQIYKNTYAGADDYEQNLKRIRLIYVTNAESRPNTVMNRIFDNNVGEYYERQIAFINEYCKKKLEALPNKSLYNHYYSTQLPTAFLLIDYLVEAEFDLRAICAGFCGLALSGQTSNQPVYDSFPTKTSFESFIDRRKHHYKHRGIFEMMLLRSIFDLQALNDKNMYACTYTNNFDTYWFNASSYMNNVIYDNECRPSVTVPVKGALKELYDKAYTIAQKQFDTNGKQVFNAGQINKLSLRDKYPI